MKWEDKTSTFEKREYLNKYLEICEVLDNKIEVNLYSSTDINRYEIYVSYGIMCGIVYVNKKNANRVRNEIKETIYNDYTKVKNKISDYPTDEFIKEFTSKYDFDIPNDLFFDENALMDSLLRLFDKIDSE